MELGGGGGLGSEQRWRPYLSSSDRQGVPVASHSIGRYVSSLFLQNVVLHLPSHAVRCKTCLLLGLAIVKANSEMKGKARPEYFILYKLMAALYILVCSFPKFLF